MSFTVKESDRLNLYSKPGEIENAPLLITGNSMCLKPNLMEHHDYIALPQDVWRHIVAWYQTDWTIIRHLKRDIVNNEVILDLYPGDYAEHLNRNQNDDGEGALNSYD